MTITAGAHSSQPSRRSARAPSDSRGRRLRPVTSGSAVTTWVLVVIGSLPFCAFRSCWLAEVPGLSGHSRDHQLRLTRVLARPVHRLLGGREMMAGQMNDALQSQLVIP